MESQINSLNNNARCHGGNCLCEHPCSTQCTAQCADTGHDPPSTTALRQDAGKVVGSGDPNEPHGEEYTQLVATNDRFEPKTLALKIPGTVTVQPTTITV
eukprot:5093884-Amphidinium_carterae.1